MNLAPQFRLELDGLNHGFRGGLRVEGLGFRVNLSFRKMILPNKECAAIGVNHSAAKKQIRFAW